MRNSLQNLLIFLALCLCALAAIQWHREANLRQQLQSASDDARSKMGMIQNLQTNLGIAEDEIKRLGAQRSDFAAIVESNRLEIAALKKLLEAARLELEKSAKQVDAFKAALQQANDNILRQNDSLKRLADDRNDAVAKFNDLTGKYNDLVKRWNDQQNLRSTNPPARK